MIAALRLRTGHVVRCPMTPEHLAAWPLQPPAPDQVHPRNPALWLEADGPHLVTLPPALRHSLDSLAASAPLLLRLAYRLGWRRPLLVWLACQVTPTPLE